MNIVGANGLCDFYDPDGHIIEVGEAMKKVIQRFLKNGWSMEEISKK